MIKASYAEKQAMKQVENAVVRVLEVQDDMITPVRQIETYLPQILKRARKRYAKELKARILWETPSVWGYMKRFGDNSRRV
jgi:hypothetical protein